MHDLSLYPVVREAVRRPNPPPGTGFTHAIPGAVVQQIETVSFTLHNVAFVATRIPVLTFLDQDGVSMGAYASTFGTLTGTSASFVFAVGINEFGATNAAHIGAPLPPIILKAGYSIALTVTAMQPTDTITDVNLFVTQVGVQPERLGSSAIEGPSTGDWTHAYVAPA